MLSRDEYRTIVGTVSEKLGADPENQTLIGQLFAHYDDTEKTISDQRTDYEKQIADVRAERDKVIGERDESRRAYRERFYNASAGGDGAQTPPPVEKPYTPPSIDQVLGRE